MERRTFRSVCVQARLNELIHSRDRSLPAALRTHRQAL